MSHFDQFVPEHIRNMPKYVAGKSVRQAQSESGVLCIKLASNENPFGPSPMAVEAIRAAAGDVNWYPDADNQELRAALAEKHGVPTDSILVTGGSSAFLHLIGRTLLAPGLNAITSERSFIIYPIVCNACGARLIRTPLRNDGFDLDAIVAAIDDDTRVIFVANPNNPTGTLVPPEEITRFLDRVPPQVLVVLDEAYADFAEVFAAHRGVQYSRSIDYVREGRNVVVLRTFSKAQGLAGLRVGYGIASPEMTQIFARMKTVFSVSSLGEVAALAALRDTKHTRRVLENNFQESQTLTRAVEDLGLRVIPTWTNFLYIDVQEDAGALGKRLLAEGVIVRPLVGGWDCPNAIRVTIGTPEQNRIFVDALRRVLASAPVK